MTALGKWPRLLIVGDPVTEEQAREILIRTAQSWSIFTGNDEGWSAYVRWCFEVESPHEPRYDRTLTEQENHKIRMVYLDKEWAAEDRAKERHGMLDLHNLGNERIDTCYADGPNGWCTWDGQLGTASYSVGKWPTYAEMSDDLGTLTEAFPYLRMNVQLVPEQYDADDKPVYGPGPLWEVRNGDFDFIGANEPLIRQPIDIPVEESIERWQANRWGIGVKKRVLRQATAQVRQKIWKEQQE